MDFWGLAEGVQILESIPHGYQETTIPRQVIRLK